MADYKLVTILGIHAKESFLTSAEVDAEWDRAVNHPAFVAAALFRGGHTAPLSGQSFGFVKAKVRAK
jgi:hypothetical protein